MHTPLDSYGDKKPDIGDFVLANLVAENSANSYHHVAEVIDKDDHEFFRQSRKCPGKFVKPVTDDIANIDRDGVVMCLSAPNASGCTKRAQSIMTFSVDLTRFNCQQ